MKMTETSFSTKLKESEGSESSDGFEKNTSTSQ